MGFFRLNVPWIFPDVFPRNPQNFLDLGSFSADFGCFGADFRFCVGNFIFGFFGVDFFIVLSQYFAQKSLESWQILGV